MPGYNGADSVVSSVKQNRTCNCLVSHTYKQFKKLWEGPEKSHRPIVGSKHVVAASALIAERLEGKKARPDDEASSSESGGWVLGDGFDGGICGEVG